MKYRNYIKDISIRLNAHIEQMSAEHSFDYGHEFEIALCKTLRLALPLKYGICRGFLVNADGDIAGDDIIIYDQDRFPSLRMIANESYSQKEKIPVEAAYAYIEAKHAIITSGEDRNFEKAISQVERVKSLVSTREEIGIKNAFNPYINMDIEIASGGRSNWPSILNPFFTAIISRYVRENKGGQPMAADNIIEGLKGYVIDSDHPPDLLVLGDDVVGVPLIEESDTHRLYSPFVTENSKAILYNQPGLGFGIGFCSLIFALDTIILGIMPWPEIFLEGINRES